MHRHGLNANLVFKWIRHAREGWLDRRRAPVKDATDAVLAHDVDVATFVPVQLVELNAVTTPASAPSVGLASTKPVREPRKSARRGALGISLPNARADRKAGHAHALLKDYRGHLHADGYAGFGGLYEADPKTGAPAPLIEVACWAHARCKIYDVHVGTKSPAAAQALEMIARLFAIECDVRGRSPTERVAVRHERANPVLDELRAFLDETLAKISGKSDFAKAIRYATSRWIALTRYVDDGRLEMSNNAAERDIRPLTLGRKNYLFAGSDEGGRRAAIMYTLIETARFNNIDPEAWLADVIARIADHPINRVDELLPWKWEKAMPQAVAA